MKDGWWGREIREDERFRGKGKERETEIEVKDEMQRWIVGGMEGRRKLKMREWRKWEGRKIEREREQKEEGRDKKDR